jgi:hypothetical protein
MLVLNSNSTPSLKPQRTLLESHTMRTKETTEDSNTLTEEQLEFLSWCERKGYFN